MEYEIAESSGLKFLLRPGTSDRVVYEDNVIRHSYEKHGIVVRPNDGWLDIGGYIGTFVVPLLAAGAKAVVFEPDPDNADLIDANLALNKMNAPLIRKAVVAVESPPMPLFKNTYRGNMAANTLYPHWKKTRPSVMVDCITFQDAFSEAQSLLEKTELSVKLDCEGAEIEILEQMPNLPIKQMTLEYHFAVSPSCERFWEISNRLNKFGFSVATSSKVPYSGDWPNPRIQTVQVYAVR